MSTIYALGLVLLFLMVLVGGKQGWRSFLSILLNFGFLFFAIVLIEFHVPPMFVTAVTGITILAVTIFMGEDDLRITVTAFYASLIVLLILIILIFFVSHWAMVQGFGNEDSDDLEGMSILIGISYLKVSVTAIVISTLGAIAEASIAISAGLTEILEVHPKINNSRLIDGGMAIGRQIIGTTLNTLFFGFFGGFLSLFIWFAGLHYSIGTIFNNKIFVAELIEILISFLGVLLTVPITSLVMVKRRDQVIDKSAETK
ncbi:MAG: YibE/F family protein [Limosilactobacillus sp.]|uniref:YibE/F family protein n=1 Tax=Limosilactobacillus sp. TaxID=2773925 RepID=UPI0025BDB716|nr:YibE/F family protein [Limosilactobacillus sp.]MCI1975198.1 YibE/F family protein [Limosilactobacillus sp.]MCI2031167.1 YibE/F family protein [Limosilactobacillus sp.]